MIYRKEIMQLKIGRETGIFVAEQVLGWQIETEIRFNTLDVLI